MEQQTGSKKEKEYVKAVYCHPAYLTSMQSTSWETLGWRKHKLESRLPGEISINLRYADDTTLMAASEEELKSLLMNFPQFVVIHIVKGFSVVNKADVFLELSWFF